MTDTLTCRKTALKPLTDAKIQIITDAKIQMITDDKIQMTTDDKIQMITLCRRAGTHTQVHVVDVHSSVRC